MNDDEIKRVEELLTSKHKIAQERISLRSQEQRDDIIEADQALYDGNSHLNIESRMNGFDNLLTQFKDQDPHKKCIGVTKTKWDKFAPYAFSKLQKQQKIETFLQLFADYNTLKKKLNEEMDKNRKIATKVHYLESQFAKVKTFNSLAPADKLRVEKEKDQEVIKLKSQIKKLHEKIIALTGNKFDKFSSRPKTANKPNKQKIIQPVNENIKVELQSERKHVRELLLIIDQFKRTKVELQAQLKQKQSNQPNIRNHSRVHVSNLKVGQSNYANKTESQFYEYSNQLHLWKQKYNDLELIYNQMNEDKDKRIRELGNQLVDLKENQRMKSRLDKRTDIAGNKTEIDRLNQRIRTVQDEKQGLQKELRQLVALPFYQNNKQIIQTQEKLTNLQLSYRKLKQQLSKANQNNIKYFAELEYKSKENDMLKTQNNKLKQQVKEHFNQKENMKLGSKGLLDSTSSQIDYDDYYRKVLSLVKLEGDDPVWRKFSAMAKPEFFTMTEKQAKETAEKLWHSKLELLAHLEKAQVQLNSLKTNMDSRINLYIKDKDYLEEELRVTRARLDQWMSMEKINNVGYRQFKVFEQAGIKYDDTLSVFDAEQKELKQLQSNQNYFDLYLGHINIDESALLKNPQNRIKNINNFISFLTVDFYNHETQHSEFTEGVAKKLANNYSFKVEVDTYLLKYLSKNSLSIQLWSPQGTATILLGKGKVYLSELITKAHKDISNVIRGKCQIYHKDKILIASVQYRIRMRLPLGPFIEWAETKKQFKSTLSKDPFALGKKKSLSLTIERAQGLPVGMNAFVYFTIQNEDFFTEPERGPIPTWDYHRDIPVTFDEEFCDELKQRYFQFTIFDDDKEVNEDVYGIAKANLTPLAEGGSNLDLKVDIVSLGGEMIGKLKFRMEVVGGGF